ncbi:uncharacterized protein LOC124647704 [Lolium rigidum]|uniref:uncharacterized protein LOC124647704 n=1 Tax=Lolium rigidum TaxID=89674 RepID=UPI001F5DFB8D|nr:uncharacterized protein LOC124647704 [Lolium rigidum]
MAPPRKKKSRQPAPTNILALGDDLLREVFLRLPSLPSLIRAALACPAFLRAVRSSPAFRRRFRDLHSPTILGAFLVDDDDTPMSTFAPLRLRDRRSDPDHAAALRGLDAFLTRLPHAIGVKKHDGEVAQDEDEEDVEDEDGPVAEWSMSACCDGYVLLVTPQWNTKKVAVYDPLTGALHLFPGPPHEVFGGQSEYTAEFHVIPSEADDRSFRLLCVPKKHWGKQIAVLSPDTREWQIATTPWSLRDAGNVELVRNGLVYWASSDQDYIPVLNAATMQFSQIDMPTKISASLGETNDGKLCLVRVYGLLIDVWVPRAGDDGVDKSMQNTKIDVWVPRAGEDDVDKSMQNTTFDMVDAIGHLALNIMDECPSLNVVAIRGGIVYLTIHQFEPPSWLLSFCIETGELQKLCRITRSEFYYPYTMAWPPALVGNKATGLSS